MTTQLEENRSRIEAGAAELRDETPRAARTRNYIETVLQSLSTGVVSVDENDRVTTLNRSAARMLGLVARVEDNPQLQSLIVNEDWLVVDRQLRRAPHRSWHRANATGKRHDEPRWTITRRNDCDGDARCERSASGRGACNRRLVRIAGGAKAAAWSEVARRMAHEIKNPLTPIQLSAERIAKSYAARTQRRQQWSERRCGRTQRATESRGDCRVHRDDRPKWQA